MESWRIEKVQHFLLYFAAREHILPFLILPLPCCETDKAQSFQQHWLRQVFNLGENGLAC